MKLPILTIIVLFTGSVLKTECKEEEKVSLGLLKIFNHFINVTDLVGGLPHILQNIAEDIVNDIRRLIPEVEQIADKYNVTEPLLKEVGNALNISKMAHELLPELEKILKEDNLTDIIKEIADYVDINRLDDEYLLELDKLLKDNNVSHILDEIKELLDVNVIADELLPEIERGLEGENITRIVEEVKYFLDMTDISEKLIPTLETIFESHNVTQIVHALDNMLNFTHLAHKLLPGLGDLFEELDINSTLQEIRKLLNTTHIHGLLDDLDDLLIEENITHHVPDLEPFLDISILRSKLTELERIIEHYDIMGIIDDIEKHLDVDHLISRVPELDELLEDLGLTSLLEDIRTLIEMSFLDDTVEDIKDFILSANLTHRIDDLEKLLNVSYLRDVIVPEIERMVNESNIGGLYDDARQFLNISFLSKHVVPEIESIWDDLGAEEKLEFIIKLTNITFLREFIMEFDKAWNITLKGEQIAGGDLAGVVNGVIDDLFVSDDKKIEVPPSIPPRPTGPTEKPAPTKEPTLPVVCDEDCAGVPCGDAFVNFCDECVMGKTGRDANHGMDCNNECGGESRNDSCGQCTKPTKDHRGSAFEDCNRECFGLATVDSCGNCTGGKTGKAADYAKDACGVCGGDNSTCLGCDNVPNSGKVNDSCKVCGGDGSTCTAISSVHPQILPTTSDTGRTVTVHGAGLNGDSIKCIFGGAESSGTVINNTHCQCVIPKNQVAGDKVFTVKVVKNSKDVATDDLRITLYDAANVKITSLTPSEILTEEDTTFTFGGSGLTDSAHAVCIVSAGEKKMKLPARFESQSYKCTLPAYKTSLSITLALSLNGIHDLSSDVELIRKVYAIAPAVTKAVFSNTGALIKIAFNLPIGTASLGACASIFSTGVASLGTSPTCTWSDARHLVITPDKDATIEPTDSLTFKSGSVKRKETFAKALASSATIDSPEDAVQPVPVIQGPSLISSCGHLTLDGSKSSGGGGRNLEYDWSLVGQANAGITAVLDAAEDKSKVFINDTLMTAGSSYTFKLSVKNFLHSSAVDNTIMVEKSNMALPEVTVDGPVGGKVLAANAFYITLKAKAAPCTPSGALKRALIFSWSVKCTQGDSADAAKARVEASAGYKKTSSKYSLKLDSDALMGGRTYEFTAVVALKKNPSFKVTVKTTVVVEWSPLEPAIVGGDRTLGRDSGKLVLDGKSSTVDPDNAAGDLHCSWTCYDKSTDQPCYSFVNKKEKINFPNQCVIEIDSVNFQAEKSYVITSRVSKGSRSGDSSIVLSVVAGKPPAVSFLTPKLRVVKSDRVKLEATYESAVKPVKVELICQQADTYLYINLSDSTLFSSSFEEFKANGKSVFVKVLKKDVLTPGASYMFTLNVDDGSKVGSSTVVVTVRSGPTSGSFDVSPTTLDQLEEVTLKAPRWVTDSDAYPLKYKFGFLDENGVFQPWKTQTSNELTIPVPPGYGANKILTLVMIVKDGFGSKKWMHKNITVNEPASIDENKVESLMDDLSQEAEDTGDFSTAVSNMKNILKMVQGNSKVSASLAKKVRNSTVTSLLLAVKSTSLDADKAKPIFDTFLEVQPTYIEKASDTLDGFSEVVKASVKSLDKDTIKDTLAWLGEVSAKANQNDPDVSKNIINTYGSLADGLLNDVDLGQTVVVKSPDNPKVEIKVAHSLLGDVVAADDSSTATELEFGSEMSGMCGQRECTTGKMCVGCQVKIITYKEDYFNDQSADKPDIIPDKIVSVSINNPESGEEQSITGLTTPFKLKFNTGNPGSGKTFKCYYYDLILEKWSNEGMTPSMIGSVLECSSTHLTSFSPAELTDNSTTTSDKEYKVSFLLSNTTWNASYADADSAATKALKNQVISEINEVYKSDSTMKSVEFESFENSDGKVKVLLKMVFTASNKDPASSLKTSIADGILGQLAVDPASLEFTEIKAKEDDDEDDIALIIGIVVGVSLLVVLIALLMAFLVHRSKQKSKVRACTPLSPQGHQNKAATGDHEMTPV